MTHLKSVDFRTVSSNFALQLCLLRRHYPKQFTHLHKLFLKRINCDLLRLRILSCLRFLMNFQTLFLPCFHCSFLGGFLGPGIFTPLILKRICRLLLCCVFFVLGWVFYHPVLLCLVPTEQLPICVLVQRTRVTFLLRGVHVSMPRMLDNFFSKCGPCAAQQECSRVFLDAISCNGDDPTSKISPEANQTNRQSATVIAFDARRKQQ